VTTWHYPRDTRVTSADPAAILRESAAAAQRELVEEVRRGHPGVQIETMVRLGYPAEILAELSASADMVVIGSHTHAGLLHGGLLHGGLASLVVGSVAIGLLHDVMLPVVIVPHG
jgi:nucleotide-binding universal stress UspA family protein